MQAALEIMKAPAVLEALTVLAELVRVNLYPWTWALCCVRTIAAFALCNLRQCRSPKTIYALCHSQPLGHPVLMHTMIRRNLDFQHMYGQHRGHWRQWSGGQDRKHG